MTETCPHCGHVTTPVSTLDRMRSLGVSYHLSCTANEDRSGVLWTFQVRYPEPEPLRFYRGESLCVVIQQGLDGLNEYEGTRACG